MGVGSSIYPDYPCNLPNKNGSEECLDVNGGYHFNINTQKVYARSLTDQSGEKDVAKFPFVSNKVVSISITISSLAAFVHGSIPSLFKLTLNKKNGQIIESLLFNVPTGQFVSLMVNFGSQDLIVSAAEPGDLYKLRVCMPPGMRIQTNNVQTTFIGMNGQPPMHMTFEESLLPNGNFAIMSYTPWKYNVSKQYLAIPWFNTNYLKTSCQEINLKFNFKINFPFLASFIASTNNGQIMYSTQDAASKAQRCIVTFKINLQLIRYQRVLHSFDIFSYSGKNGDNRSTQLTINANSSLPQLTSLVNLSQPGDEYCVNIMTMGSVGGQVLLKGVHMEFVGSNGEPCFSFGKRSANRISLNQMPPEAQLAVESPQDGLQMSKTNYDSSSQDIVYAEAIPMNPIISSGDAEGGLGLNDGFYGNDSDIEGDGFVLIDGSYQPPAQNTLAVSPGVASRSSTGYGLCPGPAGGGGVGADGICMCFALDCFVVFCVCC